MKTKTEYVELLRKYYQNNARKYGVLKMGLFGSVARNEMREDSDIDIAYEGEANILLRCRMKQELEALLGCKVDIVRLRKKMEDKDFEENILKDLIYV